MARLLHEPAPNVHVPEMRSEPPDLREEILSYLQRHPDAADTLDGVVQWWLPRQRYVEARELIERALEAMVREGTVLKVSLPGGSVVYRFGSAGAGDC